MRIYFFMIATLLSSSTFGDDKTLPPDTELFYSTVNKSLTFSDLEKADQLRSETIVSIPLLLNEKTLKPAQKVELYIRLAELYVEKHDFLRIKEMREEKDPSFVGSQAALTKAAIALKDLLAEYPNTPRSMEALFTLAKTVARLGKKEAITYFEKFITKYPKSELITDAYLALGEFYFQRGNMPQALSAYKNAIKNPGHAAYAYSVFKLAWSYYNLKSKDEQDLQANLKQSLAGFKQVVELARDGSQKAGAIQLREEAIQDLIMVFADLGEVDPAWQYFKSLGEETAFYQMLERLGNMLEASGEFKKAASLFARILEEAPKRPGNLNLQLQLVNLYSKILNFPSMLSEMQKLCKAYAQTDAEKVSATLHRLGTVYHDMGLKAKNNDYLKVAVSVYEIFLNHFPAHTRKDELRYYLADIQYELKDFLISSNNFTVVAKSEDPANKWRKDAALNAIYALTELKNADETLMIERHLYFLSIFAKEKEALAVKNNLAQIYVKRKDIAHGEPLLKEIIQQDPASAEAKASMTNLFVIYTEKQDWAALDVWLKDMEDSHLAKHDNLKANYASHKQSALTARAAAHEKANQFAEAATQYSRLYQDSNQRDEKFLYNANVNYYKAQMVEEGIQTSLTLITNHPQSKLLLQVLPDLATSYESLAQFDKAAKYNEQFAIFFPHHAKTPIALYNAAVMYRNLQNLGAFTRVAHRLIDQFPEHALAKDTFWQLAAHYEKTHDYDRASRIYERLAKVKIHMDRNAELLVQAKLLGLQVKQFPNSGSNLTSIDKLRFVLSRSENASAVKAKCSLAETLFNKTDEDFQKFTQTKLDTSKGVEAAAKAKQNHLVKIARDYRQMVELGCAEFVVAASYRLGEMHENFAKDLVTAPTPENWEDARVLEFKTEMEKVAEPLKEEAYQFYLSAFNAGQNGEAFCDWTRQSYAKLQFLRPEKHTAVYEISAKPLYTSEKLRGGYVR